MGVPTIVKSPNKKLKLQRILFVVSLLTIGLPGIVGTPALAIAADGSDTGIITASPGATPIEPVIVPDPSSLSTLDPSISEVSTNSLLSSIIANFPQRQIIIVINPPPPSDRVRFASLSTLDSSISEVSTNSLLSSIIANSPQPIIIVTNPPTPSDPVAFAPLNTLDSSTYGISTNNPPTIEPEAVPEPSSVLGLFVFGAFGIRLLLKNKRFRAHRSQSQAPREC